MYTCNEKSKFSTNSGAGTKPGREKILEKTNIEMEGYN